MRYRYIIARCLILSVLIVISLFGYALFLIASILGYTGLNTRVQEPLFSSHSYRSLTYNKVDPDAKNRGSHCISTTTTFNAISGSHIPDVAYAISAFVDNRRIDAELSSKSVIVRVLALIPRVRRSPHASKHTTAHDQDKIYCVAYYGDAITPSSHRRTVAWTGLVTHRYSLTDEHRHQYTGAILSCAPPQLLQRDTARTCNLGLYMGNSPPDLLTEVQITGGVVLMNDIALEDQKTTTAVNQPGQIHAAGDSGQPRKRTLDVCVSPLFGNSLSTRRLIEFIELYMLQGVQIIHFYNSGVSRDLLHVLQYYQVCRCATLIYFIIMGFLIP